MPRSLQQLKHRAICFESDCREVLAMAVKVLEELPGVSACVDAVHQCIAVDYWVDEYTLSDLESALSSCGFNLAGSVRARALRSAIQIEEKRERDDFPGSRVLFRSCGVLASRWTHP